MAHWPHWRHWLWPHCLVSLSGFIGLLALQFCSNHLSCQSPWLHRPLQLQWCQRPHQPKSAFPAGLIGHISLVSLGGFSGINNFSLVKLIGHISLVGLIGFSGWLARARKKLWWWIASFGYSLHNDMFPYHLAAAMQAAATHLELRVATSINKQNCQFVSIVFRCRLTVLQVLVREGELVVACAFLT